MVKGKTKSGIKFVINEEVKNDTRMLQYLVQMNDTKDSMKQAKAFFDLLKLLLGGEEGVAVFQEEIAKHNNGICNTEAMMTELQEILEAMNAKN